MGSAVRIRACAAVRSACGAANPTVISVPTVERVTDGSEREREIHMG